MATQDTQDTIGDVLGSSYPRYDQDGGSSNDCRDEILIVMVPYYRIELSTVC